MWSYTIHDTISGDRLMYFPGSQVSGRWGRTPGGGDGSHTFLVRDADWSMGGGTWRQLSEPNATTTVVAWDGVPVYAGLNLVSTYSRNAGTLEVRHVNVRALFRERNTFGVSTFPSGDLMLAGKSLSGLVRGILQRGVYDWGATWRLPLDLPADGSGGESMTVRRWEWARIDDLLVRVEKLGVTIDFDPYYTATGGLRYATKLGYPNLPGSQLEFNATADETPVTNLTWTSDGTKQISGCFYMGKGSELDMVFGEAGFVGGPGIPMRDASRSAKDIADGGKLDRMAMADLVANRSPAQEWSFDLVNDGAWSPSVLRPGTRVRLGVWGDPVIPDGNHDLIVTGVSGDGSDVLKPEVRPA